MLRKTVHLFWVRKIFQEFILRKTYSKTLLNEILAVINQYTLLVKSEEDFYSSITSSDLRRLWWLDFRWLDQKLTLRHFLAKQIIKTIFEKDNEQIHVFRQKLWWKISQVWHSSKKMFLLHIMSIKNHYFRFFWKFSSYGSQNQFFVNTFDYRVYRKI